jgi:hypothetical protein
MIRLLRKYVFHNFLLKITALVVAAVMWATVARDPVAEVALVVPIEFLHVPENIEISTESIPQAQVRVRGPGRMLRNLTPAQVRAALDLSEARPGERTYELKGTQIRVPGGVEVTQVVPAQLHLSFDRRVRKEVPIRARVIGVYGPGVRTEVAVDPPTAWIVGPERRTELIREVLTDAVDAAGLAGQATYPGVHLFVTDPLVRVASPATAEVKVETERIKLPAPSR